VEAGRIGLTVELSSGLTVDEYMDRSFDPECELLGTETTPKPGEPFDDGPPHERFQLPLAPHLRPGPGNGEEKARRIGFRSGKQRELDAGLLQRYELVARHARDYVVLPTRIVVEEDFRGI